MQSFRGITRKWVTLIAAKNLNALDTFCGARSVYNGFRLVLKRQIKSRVLNSESHVSPKGLVRVVVILPIMNPANEHDPSFGMR